jgi:hypothetical protein
MLRRHARGTSVVVTLLLAGGLAVAAAWYVVDRTGEFRAVASVAVVPASTLDDLEAIDAYTALDSSRAVATLAEMVEQQEAPDADGESLTVEPIDGTSAIAVTATAPSRAGAEAIAGDAAAVLSGSAGLLPGPFDVIDVSGAEGTAEPVGVPWVRWALVVGLAVVALFVVNRVLRRALRPLPVTTELASGVEPAPAPGPTPVVAPVLAPGPALLVTSNGNGNGNGSNGNGNGHGPLERLAPIAWSAPPPS